MLHEEKKKEQDKVNTQQYQRRKHVQQKKNTKWSSSTFPLTAKTLSPQQDSHPSPSSSTTSHREVSKKYYQLQPLPSKEDFNLDIMDFLNKLKVHVPLSWLVQFPSIRSQIQYFAKIKEEMSEDPPIILNSRIIGIK